MLKTPGGSPEGTAIQNHANVTIDREGTVYGHAADLRRAAETLMAKYPQYRGHFDEYRIGRITRNITTKSGECFVNGDWVIYKPNENILVLREYFTVWSFRVLVDVSVHYSDLQRTGF